MCTLPVMSKKHEHLLVVAIAYLATSTGISAHDDPNDITYSRLSSEYPSPRCCFAADCLLMENNARGRHAFVTTIRSPEYMVLLRELQCSIHRTNPHVPLLVLSVIDELPTEMIAEVKTFAEYREVPNIEFRNTYNPAFSKNWFKLNAWTFSEYTSLVMIDADAVVLGDLSHIFNLPTDFAWSYLNSPLLNWNKGGFIMLRPCQAVFEHMLEIVSGDESLRYTETLAEQSFFVWYFGYTGLRLPMIYNANSRHVSDSGLTAGGEKALVLHFAEEKPMDVSVDSSVWPYMCHRFFEYHKHYSSFFS